MQAYILVLFFMVPNGNMHVAHSGVESATRMSLQDCKEQMERAVESGKMRLPWVTGACVPVPPPIQADEESDRPTRSPSNT